MGKSRQASDRAWQAARKNAIINGCFRVWQRGTSSSASGYNTADRWRNTVINSGNTISRQTFTVGRTDVPGEPRYYCRCVVSSVAAAGNLATLQQHIEGVRTFAGETVTVSFWAKADSAKDIAVELYQAFGSGGSPSTGTSHVEKVTLSTSWERYSVTLNLNGISGKTIGTDDNDELSVTLWMDAGSDWNTRTDTLGQQSGTFEFSKVQVELGSEASDFEERHIGEELVLCQRYYCKSYDLDTVPGTITDVGAVGGRANTSGWFGVPVQFPVTMRAAPTMTMYNPGTGNTGQVRFGTSTTYNDTGDFFTVGQSGALARGTNASASYNSAVARIHYTADAELA